MNSMILKLVTLDDLPHDAVYVLTLVCYKAWALKVQLGH